MNSGSLNIRVFGIGIAKSIQCIVSVRTLCQKYTPFRAFVISVLPYILVDLSTSVGTVVCKCASSFS